MDDDERISPKQFHTAPGTEDWSVLFWGANAFYRTASFAEAVEFVAAIGEAAREVGHDPDVDVRPEGVAIRTTTARDGALSTKDAELAAAVSAAAHRMGLRSDPSVLQFMGVAIAQDAGADTRPFWEAAFGYDRLGDEDLVDPIRRGPHLWFHELRDPRPGRGRSHIDLSVPADQVAPRVQRALAAGGRIVAEGPDGGWVTMASPDNHGVDIAGWADVQSWGEPD